MIVITAGRDNEELILEAKQIADKEHLQFVDRNKRSIKTLFETYNENILMVGSKKIELHNQNTSMSYHPNFAQVRIKRLLKGQSDAFVEATDIKEGTTFLDCTMGMLSDSLVASFVVGKTGSVTSLEAMRDVYVTIKYGVQKYCHTLQALDEAVRRIHMIQMDAYDYLVSQEDNSVDVVYFDPMYEESVQSSSGLRNLDGFANIDSLTKKIIKEAYRVAKKRVVLKAHFRSLMFETHGFMRCVRPSSVSHYGVIIKK